MSIREFDYRNGTSLRLKGNVHEGRIYIEQAGLSFDKAGSQRELIELSAESCSDIDLQNGNIYKVSLTSDIASFSIVNPGVGTYIFIFEQDSVGGRTVTFDSTYYFLDSLGAPDFSLDPANTINIVTFLSDGVNIYVNYLLDFTQP